MGEIVKVRVDMLMVMSMALLLYNVDIRVIVIPLYVKSGTRTPEFKIRRESKK